MFKTSPMFLMHSLEADGLLDLLARNVSEPMLPKLVHASVFLIIRCPFILHVLCF